MARLLLLTSEAVRLVGALRGMATSFATLPGDVSPLNWEELGCFQLTEDDRSAESTLPVHSIHDFRCVGWRSFDSKCRSGLPFYRFPSAPDCVDCVDEDQCKLKCLSKGMDVAGLVQSRGRLAECRCGASVHNTPVWRTVVETDKVDGLQSVFYLLPPDRSPAVTKTCDVRIFQYADKREIDGAPPRALVSVDAIDAAYVQGLVAGTEEAVEIEDSSPADFDRIHESINKRLALWQRDIASNKIKRKALFTVRPRTNLVEMGSYAVAQSAACKDVKEDQSVCWTQAVKDTNCGEFCSLRHFAELRSSWCTPERATACPITCGKCQLFDRPAGGAAAVPLWPSRVIKFVFDEANEHMTPARKETFRAAVGFWASKTCLTFQEVGQVPADAHVLVTVLAGATGQPSGCSCAPVGFPGTTDHTVVNLGSCADMSKVGSVVHELGHLLGLAHTQMRPDRDDHIRVLFENIQPKFKKNFVIEPYEFTGANGKYTPYDITSIMHYSRTQGMIPELYDPVKNPGTFDVLAGIPPGTVIGQRKALSDIDVVSVNTLYGCPMPPGFEATATSSTPSGSGSSVSGQVSTAAGSATRGKLAKEVDPEATWQELLQFIAESIDAIVQEGSTTARNSLTETEVEHLLLITKLAQTLFDKIEQIQSRS